MINPLQNYIETIKSHDVAKKLIYLSGSLGFSALSGCIASVDVAAFSHDVELGIIASSTCAPVTLTTLAIGISLCDRAFNGRPSVE